MPRIKLPKIWRRVLVVAIPKPNKRLWDPKSYKLISLLFLRFKILERFICACIEPIIDPLLHKEQALFRLETSTVDQVTFLNQEFEESFYPKGRPGAVFVDLRLAYNTVRYRCLKCKLIRLFFQRHMLSMIMELVFSRRFTLISGTAKQSRLRRLKNGIQNGSVLASLLFNIYTYDLQVTVGRKFNYTDAWPFCTMQTIGRY